MKWINGAYYLSCIQNLSNIKDGGFCANNSRLKDTLKAFGDF